MNSGASGQVVLEYGRHHSADIEIGPLREFSVQGAAGHAEEFCGLSSVAFCLDEGVTQEALFVLFDGERILSKA